MTIERSSVSPGGGKGPFLAGAAGRGQRAGSAVVPAPDPRAEGSSSLGPVPGGAGRGDPWRLVLDSRDAEVGGWSASRLGAAGASERTPVNVRMAVPLEANLRMEVPHSENLLLA